MDDYSQLHTCVYSDEDGYFQFPDIAYGTYQVYAEVTGKYSTPAIVTIDENNPAFNDVFFIISGDEISLSIPSVTAELDKNTGQVYPNPVVDKGMLKIILDNSITVNLTIFDNNGQIVYNTDKSMSSGKNLVQFPTTEFSSGLYTIRITSGKQTTMRKFIIY